MVRKRRPASIEKLEEAFKELSHQPPDKPPTLLELVSAYQDWIRELVQRRHSYAAIAGAMGKKGVKISPHTLRQYFCRLERSGQRPVRAASPNIEAARTVVGRAGPVFAVAGDAEADRQPRKVVEQSGRYKPILPGETEL